MKRFTAFVLVVVLSASLLLTGCGKVKTIDGITYDTYGLLNEDAKKNPDIQYEVIWGNVFWGVVLSETIIAPIYFFCFSLFEPVGKKPVIKGQVIKSL